MLFKDAKKILKDYEDDLSLQGVRSLAIFGSTAKDKGTAKSDVDILIDYDPKKGLFAFVGIKDFLEDILECDVDLVTKNALHPALKNRILKEAKRVF